MIRTYSELSKLKTYEERFDYLRLGGETFGETFGDDRYLNQVFYTSREWKTIRDHVILRDNGCDLGIEDYQIHGKILIHHMNPLTQYDILERSDFLLDPEFMICTAFMTHNAIHYGDKDLLILPPVERTPYDTCPWKK